MRSVNEIKASIQQSITYDNRVSPDYANSFQLKRDIDELVALAKQHEERMEHYYTQRITA